MATLAALGEKGALQGVARAAAAARLQPEALAKVFQRLARHGLLSSRRGPGGGYALARPADKITLAEIARAVGEGGRAARMCALGGALCGQRPCPIHSDVLRADAMLAASLAALTLEDLLRHKLKELKELEERE